MIGVAKAYISRVGSGPFPTELDNPIGEKMVEIGGEFGTVTGRRSRCGWLDMVALRYAVTGQRHHRDRPHQTRRAVRTSTVSESPSPTTLSTTATPSSPASSASSTTAILCTRTCPGGVTDISKVTRYEELPKEAQQYVEYVEDAAGVPMRTVSVGPSRAATLSRA